jgi:hypothetical protein
MPGCVRSANCPNETETENSSSKVLGFAQNECERRPRKSADAENDIHPKNRRNSRRRLASISVHRERRVRRN